jgi:putative oxidoreductase
MAETTLNTIGTTALRVGVGATLIAHGTQKLFGWFGGYGPTGTGQFFESIGFKPGKPSAIAAGLGEAGGGALLVLGLATPAAGAAVAGNMVVAATTHVDNGFFVTSGGFEYPAVLGLIGASFAATGAGPFSLDAALGGRLDQPWMRVVALAAVLPVVGVVVLRRRTALADAAARGGAGGSGGAGDERAAGTAPGASS